MRIRLFLLALLVVQACATPAAVADEVGSLARSIERIRGGLGMIDVLWSAPTVVTTMELTGADSSDITTLYAIPGLHWRGENHFELGIGVAAAGAKDDGQFSVLAAFRCKF